MRMTGPGEMESNKRCINCAAFERSNDLDAVDYWGTCHRHAPRPENTGGEFHVQWPIVNVDDTCYEWAVRSEEQMNEERELEEWTQSARTQK